VARGAHFGTRCQKIERGHQLVQTKSGAMSAVATFVSQRAREIVGRSSGKRLGDAVAHKKQKHKMGFS
jgi:hypothetical protein